MDSHYPNKKSKGKKEMWHQSTNLNVSKNALCVLSLSLSSNFVFCLQNTFVTQDHIKHARCWALVKHWHTFKKQTQDSEGKLHIINGITNQLFFSFFFAVNKQGIIFLQNGKFRHNSYAKPVSFQYTVCITGKVNSMIKRMGSNNLI